MARSKRRVLRQYGIGCGLLVLFGLLVLAVSTVSVFVGYREAAVLRDELEQGHDTQEDYTPPGSGGIPSERLRRFLAVRMALAPLCETVSEHQRIFARMAGHADAENPPAGPMLRDAFRAATSAVRMGRDYGSYVTARNEALLENDMGLGEYTWIYVVAYHSWLGHRPVQAVESNSRKRIFRDRVLPQVHEMVRRQVAREGDAPAAAVWRAELERLDRDPERLPFEDGLTRELEDSLAPYREELERMACPPASELEVVLTVRSGIGYDHR